MALVARPNTKAIPERVGLVIVSNLCALVNSWLPKAPEKTTGVKRNKGTVRLWVLFLKRKNPIHVDTG